MFFSSALNTAVQIKPGDSLVLKLDVSDPVEVIYNSTGAAGPSSGQICTVDGPSLQCKPEYTQRSSLTSGLQLRRMTPSESGVYIIMDSRNKEVIHTYTVTVQGMILVFFSLQSAFSVLPAFAMFYQALFLY